MNKFREEYARAYKHWSKSDLAASEALACVVENQKPETYQIDTSKIEKILVVGFTILIGVLLWKM